MAPLWKNIFRINSTEKSLANFLANSPVFSELTSRERYALTEYLHIRHYDPAELIYSEGDVGSGFYLIRSGHVRLFLELPDSSSVELARLEAGNFFGETALTEAAPRLYCAEAIEAVELVGLFRSDLMQLAQNRPVLCNKVLLGLSQVLSKRIRAMEILHRENHLPQPGEK